MKQALFKTTKASKNGCTSFRGKPNTNTKPFNTCQKSIISKILISSKRLINSFRFKIIAGTYRNICLSLFLYQYNCLALSTDSASTKFRKQQIYNVNPSHWLANLYRCRLFEAYAYGPSNDSRSLTFNNYAFLTCNSNSFCTAYHAGIICLTGPNSSF